MMKKILTSICALATVTFGIYAVQRIGVSQTSDTGKDKALSISKSATEDDVVYKVPVTFQPTEDQFLDEMVIVDGNEDNVYWKYDYYNDCLKYGYSYSNQADDWAIFPAVELPAGSYKISISYKVASSSYPEAFELCIGNEQTVESMGEPILEMPNLTNNSWETSNCAYTQTESGIAYIGVHGISDKNKYALSVKDLTIEAIDNSTPSAPEITGLEMEGVEGNVSILFPSKDMAGEDIDGNLGIEFYIDETPVIMETSEMYAPGSTQQFPITLISGTHILKARVYIIKENNSRLYSEFATYEFTAHKIQPVPLPIGYTILPDMDEAAWVTAIDSNNDGNTWNFDYSKDLDSAPAFSYRADPYFPAQADDWLIMPAYDGNSDGLYELTFEIGSRYQAESFEVCYGLSPDPEELKNNILVYDNSLKTYLEYKDYSKKFYHEGNGNFYIAFHATSPSGASNIYLKNIKVAESLAADPEPASFNPVFNGNEGKFEITLPLKSIDKKDIEGDVYCQLTIDGSDVADEYSGLPGETIEIPMTLEYGNHSAILRTYILDENYQKVYAEDINESFRIFLSTDTVEEIPATFPLNQTDFNYYMVSDGNNDGRTWTPEAECISYQSLRSTPGNDWIFMTKVNLNADEVYAVSLDYKGAYRSYRESFEIWIGEAAAPEAMERMLVKMTDITNTEFDTVSSNLKVSEPGSYVIGIRATSIDAYLLSVKNLSVNTSFDIPASPEISIMEAEDNQSVTLNWDEVTSGVLDTEISGIQYKVSVYDTENESWSELADQAGLEYTYSYSGTDQEIVTLGVEAYEPGKGISDKKIVNVMLGSALSLPVSESFENGQLTLSPVMFNDGPLGNNNDVQWSVNRFYNIDYAPEGQNKIESDAPSFVLEGKAQVDNVAGSVTLPKIKVPEDKKITGIFTIYNNPDVATMEFYAVTPSGETLISSLTPSEQIEWTDFRIIIPENILNHDWVQLVIKCSFPNGRNSIAKIGNYSFVNLGVPTGIEEIKENAGIYSRNGLLHIEGCQGKSIQIFNMTGLRISAIACASDYETIPLETGIYVIYINETAYKLLMK